MFAVVLMLNATQPCLPMRLMNTCICPHGARVQATVTCSTGTRLRSAFPTLTWSAPVFIRPRLVVKVHSQVLLWPSLNHPQGGLVRVRLCVLIPHRCLMAPALSCAPVMSASAARVYCNAQITQISNLLPRPQPWRLGGCLAS